MEILRALPDPPMVERTAVALGNFDGVHRGHQVLISRTVTLAREMQGQSVVLTFDPHPMHLLKPQEPVKLILTGRRKSRKIAELGTDVLVLLPFTRELASMGPDEFGTMIFEALKPAVIVVGFNYTYGYRGQGTPATLAALGRQLGFRVEVVPPQTEDGELISSTGVRQALMEGKVEKARRFLGYWPLLEGIVQPGDGRGKTLGFPTANVVVDGQVLLPRAGVYAAEVRVEGRSFLAVVNIGRRPTFKDDEALLVEAHLVDFSGNLYGRELEVHLLKYLRSEKKFADVGALKEQIAQDIRAAQQVARSL